MCFLLLREKMNIRKLKTKDITLEYIDNLNDKKYCKYMNFSNKKIITESKIIADIEEFREKKLMGLYGCFINNNDLIGTTRFSDYDNFSHTIIIGIMIFKKYSNHGLGNTFLSLVCRYLEIRGIRKIYCAIYTKNLNSVKLFLNNNFIIEGLQRQYAIVQCKTLDRYILSR